MTVIYAVGNNGHTSRGGQIMLLKLITNTILLHEFFSSCLRGLIDLDALSAPAPTTARMYFFLLYDMPHNIKRHLQ